MPFIRSLFFLLMCFAPAAWALEAFPAGAPMNGPVSFVYAIYYLQPPAVEPLAALNATLAQLGGKFKVVQQLADAPSEPQMAPTLDNDIQKNYPPPSVRMIEYFGRGLSKAQAEALQLAQTALVLEFRAPASPTYAALRAADSLLLQVAEQTGGLIWDEETREIFTTAEWRKRHVDGWQGDVPNIVRHTVIHAYQGDKLIREITLGMAKFGLPDVVISDVAHSQNNQAGNLINILAQALVEGATIGQSGVMTLNLKTIRHDAFRNAQLPSLTDNAKAQAQLLLYKGQPEEGDPRNRLLEVGFDRYPGPDRYAQQTALFASLFGFTDTLQMVKHTDAVLAASTAAKTRLPALRQRFNAGLKPGEYILVKAPFATPEKGREWMWVEVTKWEEHDITGLLNNEPAQIPTLHSGQIVKVKVADVFDYLLYDGKGGEEGNESGKLMARQRAGQ
ncbi:DUF2314 domain-containing protein [Duganella sp.]|uniref:DUF2314 domain-containing protein n=1 Tax=Duganella sp. TaxID=1904440 RepID=UPI0031DBC9E1